MKFNFSRTHYIGHYKKVDADDYGGAVGEAKTKKEFVHSVKVGDIFGTHWGYEQTNREFFQVIGVKGKSVIIRELAQESGPDDDPGYGAMAGTTRFIRDQFIGEPDCKLVLNDNNIEFASFRRGHLVTDEENKQGFYVSRYRYYASR